MPILYNIYFAFILKTMLVKQSTMDGIHQVDLTDCGLLWKDTDRLAVQEVILVDHTFEKEHLIYSP